MNKWISALLTSMVFLFTTVYAGTNDFTPARSAITFPTHPQGTGSVVSFNSFGDNTLLGKSRRYIDYSLNYNDAMTFVNANGLTSYVDEREFVAARLKTNDAADRTRVYSHNVNGLNLGDVVRVHYYVHNNAKQICGGGNYAHNSTATLDWSNSNEVLGTINASNASAVTDQASFTFNGAYEFDFQDAYYYKRVDPDGTNSGVCGSTDVSYTGQTRTGLTQTDTSATFDLGSIPASYGGNHFIYFDLVVVNQNICGNGIVGTGEQCDDGNTTAADGCSATCQTETSGISITKAATPVANTNVQAGDPIAYTLTISNTGQQNLTNVSATDVLDTDVSYVSGDAGVSHTAGTVSVNVGALAVGQTVTRSFNVQVNAGVTTGTIDNTASVVGTPGVGANVTNTSGTNTHPVTIPAPVCGNGVVETGEQCDDGNTTAADGCSATCQTETSGISITKATNPATGTSVVAGDTITYTLTISNTGQQALTNVVATNVLDTDVTYVSSVTVRVVNNAGTVVHNGGTVTVTVGNLGVGATVTRSFQVQVNAGVTTGTIDNVTTVVGTPTVGVDVTDTSGTNTHPITIPVPVCGNGAVETGEQCDDGNTTAADGCSATCQTETSGISIMKAANPATGTSVVAGDTIDYILTISNTGQQALTNVSATDVLDTDVTYVTSADAGVVDNGGTVTVTVGNLGVGATVTRSFQVQVNAGVTTGTIDNVTTVVGTPTVGGNVTGASNATNHPITVPVPVCGNGAVETGEQCDDGNTTAADGCSATCQTETSGISITKAANPVTGTSVVAGDTIDYILTISNTGQQALTNVSATDVLDTDVTYVTSADAGVVDNGGTVTVTVGNLGVGATVTRSFQVQVNAGVTTGTIDNVATVVGTPTVGVDVTDTSGTNTHPVTIPTPVCGNGAVETGEQCDDGNTTAADGCSATCQTETSGISITKAANPVTGTSVVAGDTIDYILTISNTGQQALTNVSATDVLDTDVTYVTSADAGVVDNGGTVTVTVGNLGVGATVTRSFQVQVNAGVTTGTIDNVTTVVGTPTVGVDVTDTSGTNTHPVTIPTPVCGNGAVETGEQCDDGNTTAADGCSATCQTETSGISITKAANPVTGTSVVAGDTIDYILTISNTGQQALTNVSATDVLDTDVTYVTSADAGVVHNGGTVTVTVGNLGVGATETRSFQVQVNAGVTTGTIDNVATVVGTPTVGVDVTDTSGTNTHPVTIPTPVCGNGAVETGEQCDDGNTTAADGCSATCQTETSGISITKAANPATGTSVVAGDTIDYILTISNTGQQALTNVSATDVLDTDVTYVTSADAGVVHNGGTVTVTVGNLGVGATVTRSFQVQVNAGVTTGTIDNVTTVVGTPTVGGNVTGASNATNHPITVPALVCGNGVVDAGEQCDDGNTTAGDGCSATCQTETSGISITKAANPVTGTSVVAGDTITYTIAIQNTGQQALTNVSATDVLDTDVSYVSGDAGVSHTAGTVSVNVGALAVGQTVTRSFNVQVNTGVTTGTIDNVATVVGTPTVGVDVTDTSGTNTHPVTIPTPVCGNGAVETGEQCDDGNTTAADGCSATCQTETSGISIMKAANPATGTSVVAGDTIDYILTISNTGQQALTNVSATDVLDTDVSYVSGDAGVSHTAGTVSVNVGALAVGQTVTRSFNVQVNAGVTTGTIDNTATVVGTPTVGGNVTGASNATNHPITVPVPVCGNGAVETGEQCDDGNTTAADGCSATCQTETSGISITKAANPVTGTSVVAGDTITYTIAIQNTGQQALTNVSATDVLDTDVTYVTSADAGVVHNGGTVTVTVGNLGVGATETRSFQVQVNAGVTTGTIDNTASVVGTPGVGANVTNTSGTNTHPVTIPAPVCGNGAVETGEQCDDGNTTAADGCSATCQTETSGISITKAANPATGTSVVAGDTITYTIAIQNTGQQALTNVSATDVLDTDVTYVTSADAGVVHNGGTVTVTVGNLGVGATETRSFQVQVNAGVTTGTIDNTASVVGTPGVGANVTNTSGTNTHPVTIPTPVCGNGAVETGEQCDDGNTTAADGCSATCQTETSGISITKAANPATGTSVVAGDTITYTIAIQNTGQQALTNVSATDVLDTDVTYVTSADAGVVHNGGTVTVTVGNLGVGATVTRSFQVQVNAGVTTGTIDNVTTVVGTPTVGVDVTDTSGTNTHPITIPTPVCGNGAVETGEQCDDGNTTAADGCSATCQTETSGISITKAANPATGTSVVAGDTITYTIAIQNTGQQALTNVSATDVLDTDVTYVTSADAGVVHNGGTVTVTVGNLGVGATETRSFQVQVNAGVTTGTIDNVATVVGIPTVGVDVTDTSGTNTHPVTIPAPVCGNGAVETGEQCDDGNTTAGDGCSNICQIEVCGNGVVDAGEQCDDGNTIAADGCSAICFNETSGISITKAANPVTGTSVVAGDTIDYILTISNTGQQALTNVSATDVLDTDVTYVTSADAGVVHNGGTVTVTVGTLGVGATETRSFQVQVNAGVTTGTIDNVATVVGTPTVGVDVTDTSGTNTHPVTIPTPVCGNGAVETGEQCDDGNTTAADGCSATCLNESSTISIIKNPTPASGTNVQPNDVITYALTVTNTGQQTLTNVMATDVLDTDVTYVSSADTEVAHATGTVTVTVGTMAPGVSQIYTFQVRVNAGAVAGDVVTNQATVAGLSALSVNVTGNSNTTTHPIIAATPNCGNGALETGEQCDDSNNISGDGCSSICLTETSAIDITKTANPVSGSNMNPSDNIVYTLTVTNAGQQNLTNVTATDVLDANLQYVTGKTGVSHTAGTVTVTVGSLPVGTSQSFEFTAQVIAGATAGTVINNTASVVGTPTVGVNVTDTSNTTVHNVVLPAPVCGNGAVETGEQCDDSNTTAGDGCSVTCQNETSSVAIRKSAVPVSGSNIEQSSNVVFTLEIENNGQQNLTNVVATDTLDTRFVFQTGDTEVSHTAGVVTVTIPTLNVGVTETVSFTVQVDSSAALGVINNEASVVGTPAIGANVTETSNQTTHTIVAPTPSCGNGVVEAPEQCDDGNNIANDGCSATCQTENASIALVKTPDPVTGTVVTANQNIEYSLAVTNNGLQTINTVTLTDTLDTDVTFVSSAQGQVTHAAGVVTVNVGTLIVNETQTFTFIVSVNDPVVGIEVINTASATGTAADTSAVNEPSNTVTHPIQNVANCGNGAVDAGEQCDDSNTTAGDGCSATCQFENTALELVKSALSFSGSTIDDQDEIVYTLTVTNPQLRTVQSVVVTDALNANVTFVDSNPTGDTRVAHNAGTVTGTLGDLASGASANISFRVSVNDGIATTSIPNQASVTGTPAGTATAVSTNSNQTIHFVVASVNEICGNGRLEGTEQCDDGNTTAGDGCSNACQLETIANCGNGTVDAGEQCDDGNTISGDACNNFCQFETGCGNGTVESGEQCDDGNLVDKDGCSATCITEGGGGGSVPTGGGGSPSTNASIGICKVAGNGAFQCENVIPQLVSNQTKDEFDTCRKIKTEAECLEEYAFNQGYNTCSHADSTYLHAAGTVNCVDTPPVLEPTQIDAMVQNCDATVDCPGCFGGTSSIEKVLIDEDGNEVETLSIAKGETASYRIRINLELSNPSEYSVDRSVNAVTLRVYDYTVPAESGNIWIRDGLMSPRWRATGPSLPFNSFTDLDQDGQFFEMALNEDMVDALNASGLTIEFDYDVNSEVFSNSDSAELKNVAFALTQYNYIKNVPLASCVGDCAGQKVFGLGNNVCNADVLTADQLVSGSATLGDSAVLKIFRPAIQTSGMNLGIQNKYITTNSNRLYVPNVSEDLVPLNDVQNALYNETDTLVPEVVDLEQNFQENQIFFGTEFVSGWDQSHVYLYDGDWNANTPVVINSAVDVNAIGTSATFIIQNADLIIEGDVNLNTDLFAAFVVKNGDIIVDPNVVSLDGMYVVENGSFMSQNNQESDVQLEVSGSMLGSLFDLIDKRTYIGVNPEVELEPNVRFIFDVRLLDNTPPGLESFLGEEWKQVLQ